MSLNLFFRELNKTANGLTISVANLFFSFYTTENKLKKTWRKDTIFLGLIVKKPERLDVGSGFCYFFWLALNNFCFSSRVRLS